MLKRKLNTGLLTLCTTCLVLMFCVPAWSQSYDAGVLLELNKVESTDETCRLSFVMENATGKVISSASYEIVLFDSQGVINQLSVFDFGDLPIGKTVVRQFDLTDLACSEAGRLLINGPSNCTAVPASPHCSAPLALSSKAELHITQ